MLNILLAIVVVFLERRNAAVTWAWLMVLFFLPVVGFVLYLFLGQNLTRRRFYKIQEDKQKIIDALIQNQKRDFRQKGVHYKDPSMVQYQDMIYMNLTGSHALYSQNNEVEIFTEGTAKFAALLRDMEEAKDHIHLMYFIVRDDGLSRRLMELLTAKAKEGVEVRFLYDAIGSSSLSKRFFQNLKEAGGQVEAFFPSRIRYINKRLNYRNHRKLAIIDGHYGYIGGLNIGEEYLGLSKRFGYWRDTHLRLKGGAVLQMQAQFLLDWNLASASPVSHELSYFPIRAYQGNVGIQIVSSGPDTEWQEIKNAYIKMILAAKETVLLQTPYFVPDESLITALKMAALSGVSVKLMIPSKPDHRFVYWATRSYIGELLTSGVNCFLYEKGFLHAKTIVVDGKIATAGTANMDNRSFKLNFEVNAFIYDTEVAGRLQRIFDQDLENCRELTLAAYRKRPLNQRFVEAIARLLSPIL